jgi:nuclear transcription factor Y, gamma
MEDAAASNKREAVEADSTGDVKKAKTEPETGGAAPALSASNLLLQQQIQLQLQSKIRAQQQAAASGGAGGPAALTTEQIQAQAQAMVQAAAQAQAVVAAAATRGDGLQPLTAAQIATLSHIQAVAIVDARQKNQAAKAAQAAAASAGDASAPPPPVIPALTPAQRATQIQIQTQALIHAHTQAQIQAGIYKGNGTTDNASKPSATTAAPKPAPPTSSTVAAVGEATSAQGATSQNTLPMPLSTDKAGASSARPLSVPSPLAPVAGVPLPAASIDTSVSAAVAVAAGVVPIKPAAKPKAVAKPVPSTPTPTMLPVTVSATNVPTSVLLASAAQTAASSPSLQFAASQGKPVAAATSRQTKTNASALSAPPTLPFMPPPSFPVMLSSALQPVSSISFQAPIASNDLVLPSTSAKKTASAVSSTAVVAVNSTSALPDGQQPNSRSPAFLAQLSNALNSFWKQAYMGIQALPPMAQEQDFKNHNDLPLARIKRIMKSDEDVRMISAEAPVLFAKACEFFILDLSIRSWNYSLLHKRRTLQKEDVREAIQKTDIFDFLVDVIQ